MAKNDQMELQRVRDTLVDEISSLLERTDILRNTLSCQQDEHDRNSPGNQKNENLEEIDRELTHIEIKLQMAMSKFKSPQGTMKSLTPAKLDDIDSVVDNEKSSIEQLEKALKDEALDRA